MAAPLAVGRFTLTAGTTSTSVVVPLCTPASIVTYSPMTPHAANDIASTSVVPGNGQFVLTHASNPRTDRMFSFAIVG